MWMQGRRLVTIFTVELHRAGPAMHASDLNFIAIQLD